MNWAPYFTASVVIFCLTCFLVFVLYNSPKRRLKTSLYKIFFWGIAISLFMILFPITFNDEYVGGLGRIFFTVARAFMVFTGGMSIEFLDNAIGLQPWHYAYAAILSVVAFGLTIGFILQFFSGFFVKIRCKINRSRKLYLFSELNEKSIILAKSIKDSVMGKMFIVFADSPGKNTDEDYINEAKSMGALLLNEDVVCFPLKKRKEKTQIILCKEKEIDNINDVVVLLGEEYENGGLLEFFVFSSEEEYENIVSSCVKKKVDAAKNKKAVTVPRVRIVDSIHSEIYRLFEKYPLYLGTDKRTAIQLMVIGSGKVAREAVRIASWFGQMISKQLSILMVCNKPDVMECEFMKNYPEIRKNCPIEFKHDALFDYYAYADNDGKETNYIIVAEDDDLSSLKTAVQLRTIFAGAGLKNGYDNLLICVWNEEGKLHNELRNENKGAYLIIPFGGLESRYSYKNIFNNETDEKGLKIHCNYCNYDGAEDEYYNSEYNRKSSCALALHISYTIFEMEQLYNGGKKMTNSDYEEIMESHSDELLHAEHVRWSAFMRARGYKIFPLDLLESLLQKKAIDSHIDDTAKLHACLVDWNLDYGNPISEQERTFENTDLAQIIQMKNKHDVYDDLDMLTLTCWEYLKKDPCIFEKKGKKQKVNFKEKDRMVLEVMIPLMIEEEKSSKK